MKSVGIIQPNYIPWRGYFDFISKVDVFIFLDDVQYTKQDWRNRNKIRWINGELKWLSVPVKAKTDSLIMDVEIDYSKNWMRQHLEVLKQNYGRAPFFDMYFDSFRQVLESEMELLSDLDIALCRLICSWLGIETELLKASDLDCTGIKDSKLIDMMHKVGGTNYLSGPAARAYIQPHLWDEAGLKMSYFEYPDYPAYRQISEPFEPFVSILDLLFMTGQDAPNFIWKETKRAQAIEPI